MTYLLIAVLFALFFLIIVLAAFIIFQQKQIASIQKAAQQTAPTETAPEAEPVVPSSAVRLHEGRPCHVVGFVHYQPYEVEDLKALINAAQQHERVLCLDLTRQKEFAPLWNLKPESDRLIYVSDTLSYQTLSSIQKIEDELSSHAEDFDSVYVMLPALNQSRTVALLPRLSAYVLTLTPEANAHALEDTVDILTDKMNPQRQHFLGILIHNNQAPVARQIVEETRKRYTELVLGVLNNTEDAETVYVQMQDTLNDQSAVLANF